MNDSIEDYFNTDIQGIILSGSGDIEKITYSNIKKDNLSFSLGDGCYRIGSSAEF